MTDHILSGWWFQLFDDFKFPLFGEMIHIDLRIFLRWVETSHQPVNREKKPVPGEESTQAGGVGNPRDPPCRFENFQKTMVVLSRIGKGGATKVERKLNDMR